MVKVPGFFAGKKGGVSTKEVGSMKKPPMMVVRSEKPISEIFWPEMITTEAGKADFARKQPVVTMSMEKPRPKTSLPEMGSFDACDGGNKVTGFQESIQQKLKLPFDEGIMEDRMQHQPGSAVIEMSAESFEVVRRLIRK